MAQILQIKRTNQPVTNSAEPLSQFSNENIAQGEMFYANAGVTGLAGSEEGVLYIGTDLTAGNTADAIGGKAFTKMLSPKQHDTATVITQAGSDGDNGGDAAKLTLADGQKTSLQKTMSIAAPDVATADDVVFLPAAPGSDSTTADTIITTNGTGKVGALTSSGTITGLTVATANASINNIGTVTATSVDSSGTIDGTTITGTTLATGGASINDDGAVTADSVAVGSGAIDGGTITGTTLATGAASISNGGAISGDRVTVNNTLKSRGLSIHESTDFNDERASISNTGIATVAALNAGAGTIQTTGVLNVGSATVDSLSVSNGGINYTGAITGATSITASGKISAAELEISGDMIVANTTDITIEDNLLQVASTATGSNTTNQSGWYAKVNDGSDGLRYAGMVYDNADAKFKVLQEDDGNAPTTSFNDATQATGTLVANVEGDTAGTHTGAVVGGVTGNVTGNADTATALAADMTLTLGGDLTGAVTTRGTSQTLTATIADASVEPSMLHGTVELKSLNGVDSYAAADAGKVLTVDSEGNLEWTSKTASGGENGGSLYGIKAKTDTESDAGEVNIELTDDEAGANDRITLKEGANVTLTLDDTAGDEKITITAEDNNTQLSQTEVQNYIPKSYIDGLNVTAANSAKVNNLTVETAVPAGALFSDTNTQATYSIAAVADGQEVDLNLTGAGEASGTDTVTFAATGGATVSVSNDVITIDSEEDTNTTYDLTSDDVTGGAKITLDPSAGDDQNVEIKGAGATTVSHSGSTITVTSTDANDNDNDFVTGLGLSGTVLTATVSGGQANPTVDLNSLLDNTDTTYELTVGDNANGVNLNLKDSDNADDTVVLKESSKIQITSSGSDVTFTSLHASGDFTHDQLNGHDPLQHQAWAADVSGQYIHEANIQKSATWDGTTSTVDSKEDGWDGAKTAVDGSDATYVSAGELVEWGASGALSTSGDITAGAVVSNAINSAGNITINPNSGNGSVTISLANGESILFDGDGITATGTMSLEGFTTDGGVLT